MSSAFGPLWPRHCVHDWVFQILNLNTPVCSQVAKHRWMLTGSRPYLQTWSRLDRPRWRRVSWRRHIQEHRIKKIRSLPGVLQHYIRPLLAPPSGGDSLLSAPSLPIQRAAISWRLNKSFVNRTCPCGLRFNRAHLLHALPPNISATPLWRDFESSVVPNAIRNELRSKNRRSPTFQYTFFDHLLNNSEFEKFFVFYQHVDSRLFDS